MNRIELLKKCPSQFDVIIIGGGATGLGAAVDAAARGYKTLLLEQHDFAKGTSSRSTKLIHGGLRYLKQGNIALVVEALKERGLLCQNAPHLVGHLGFLVPNYHWWQGPFYGIGIKLYDLLAGKLGLEKSEHLNREETLKRIPTLEPKDLRGATIYYDGQFDDARLAISLAQTAVSLGASVLNYFPVKSFVKEDGVITGVKAIDLETKKEHTFFGKVIINATGVFSDNLRKLDDKKIEPIIAPSQGIHLVLPLSFMPSKTAILIPETEDGRVVFFVPWHDHLLIGTTDTAKDTAELEPKPLDEEIDFLLKLASHYLATHPKKGDILSVFTGLRPLVKAKNSSTTAALSRDHTILVSESGLITIAGGKWTTYRKMAQDVIDKAILVGDLQHIPCKTEHLHLHGFTKEMFHEPFQVYGNDAKKIQEMIEKNKKLGEKLHPDLPYIKAQVIWAIENEMARTLEDVLARRTRALFLNAKATSEIAEEVVLLMAEILQKDDAWVIKELENFNQTLKNYLV